MNWKDELQERVWVVGLDDVDAIESALTAAGYAVVPVEMDCALYGKVHGLADALYNGDAFDWHEVLPQLHRKTIAAARGEE